MIRIYSAGPRSRVGAIALAAAALATGGVLLAFGILLLLGVAAVGTVVGAGVLLYRSLTGRGARHLPRVADPELDPSLEVFPERSTVEPPRKLTGS